MHRKVLRTASRSSFLNFLDVKAGIGVSQKWQLASCAFTCIKFGCSCTPWFSSFPCSGCLSVCSLWFERRGVPKPKLQLILQFLVGSKIVISYLKFKLDKTNYA